MSLKNLSGNRQPEEKGFSSTEKEGGKAAFARKRLLQKSTEIREGAKKLPRVLLFDFPGELVKEDKPLIRRRFSCCRLVNSSEKKLKVAKEPSDEL